MLDYMILDILFPKKCLQCGREGKYICSDCLGKVGTGAFIYSNYSLFKYEGVMRKAIIKLKYKFATDIANELAEVCVNELKGKIGFKNLVLVPIPLHWKRENERGFNQVEIIGNNIAKELNWKFVPNLLIRKKSTIPQVQLRGDERRKNLKGIFEVNKNSILSTDSSVLLFDDVYTTGSTINEAKKALSKVGFGGVRSMTIAR